jgi:hypothetical protein
MAAGWFALRAPNAAPDAVVMGAAEPPARAEPEGTGVVEVVPAASPDARVAAGSPPSSAAAAPMPEEGSEVPPASSEPQVVLAGRFVLHRDGLPIDAALDGTARLTAWSKKGGRGIEVPVVDSLFEVRMATVEGGVQLLVADEVVRELPRKPEYFEVSAPEASGFEGLQLRDDDAPDEIVRSLRLEAGAVDAKVGLRQAGAVTLEVVAAESGAHLTGVDVHHLKDELATVTSPLGQRMLKLAAGAASPVPLQRSGPSSYAKEATLLVGAPGYAWKRVKMDLSKAGDRRVELVASGGLRVSYEGFEPRAAQLRLYSGGVPYADFRMRDNPTKLEGLTPGTYQLKIEVGKWYSDPAVLGEEQVTVLAGQETAVTVPLQPQVATSMAPLSGTLRVAEGWDHPRVHLALVRLSSSVSGAPTQTTIRRDELSPVPGQDGHFTFEVANLETGTYSIEYAPLNLKQVFEHPPEGTRDYVFEVPTPTEVTVRVVLKGTSEALADIERIAWRPAVPEESRGGGLLSAMRDKETGDFHFQVPRGAFAVMVFHPTYVTKTVEFDASTATDFVAEIQKAAVCSIELRSGDEFIPWPDSESVDLVDPLGEASIAYLGSRGAERWFTVGVEGRYSVQAPSVEGFMPSAPVEVNLVLGEEHSLVIELTRK